MSDAARPSRRESSLLSIGGFSFRTGLSITALRHYDEVGLLVPRSVDPLTGYRRYHPDQVRTARLICGLRAIDLPIDEIRKVISADDATTRAVLERHRDRLGSRARELSRMTATVDEYSTREFRCPNTLDPGPSRSRFTPTTFRKR